MDDGAPLTADDVEAAASVGRLPALTRQLVIDGSWASLEVVLRYARDSPLPLEELDETVRALREAVAALSANRRASGGEEIQMLLRQAAFTVLRRLSHDPLTAAERSALGLAAAILQDLGELERAARVFERAGDELRAAEAYGALGDLDRMEACLRREEQHRLRRQSITEAVGRVGELLASGERREAIAVAARIPEDDFDANSTRAQGASVERRLCRRRLMLRLSEDVTVTFVALPAMLGRDGLCEVVLRDLAVSRRHALIEREGDGFALRDLGSRGGTRLANASVRGRLSLPAEGELMLAEHCVLRLASPPNAPGILAITGTGGLDRGLRAFVGSGLVPLSLAFPEAEGLTVHCSEEACRLERTRAVSVRVDGRLIGPGCDLLHGDVVEVADRLRLEVL